MVKSPVKNDSDTPWKDLLEKFFEPFLAFFFPHIHKDIQWKIPPEFLDKEFQKIVRDAALGRRFADKLVKVHRKNGDETWIYIHVEVQGKEEKVFSERMMVYHYRIFDTYRKPVVSLAVLADGNKEWRPREYVNSLWNCSFSLEFPVVKLLDFDESALLPRIKSNPFALVVLAHQKARISAGNDEIRYDFKWKLFRLAIEIKMDKQKLFEFLRCLDWMLNLPPELEIQFRDAWHSHEEEQKMPYITSFERLAKNDGLQQGRIEGRIEGLHVAIELGMELKFGREGLSLVPEISKITDLPLLQAIKTAIKDVESLEDVRSVYTGVGGKKASPSSSPSRKTRSNDLVEEAPTFYRTAPKQPRSAKKSQSKGGSDRTK